MAFSQIIQTGVIRGRYSKGVQGEKDLGKELKRKTGIFFSLVLYFIYAVLLMIRTKVLVENYGSEVNAVFQTASQIFAYFCLIESGMSMAYQFKLYEPVNHNNTERIAALFMGLKKSMKKISAKMLAVLTGITLIYPFIMDRVSLSAAEAGGMLFLLGLRLVIPYFTSMASKALLNVYDYKYLLDLLDSMAYIAIALAELFSASVLHLPIHMILLMGCVGNIIMGIVYGALLERLCKEIKGKKADPDFGPEEMTGDILFLRIAGLLNSSIDMIILSIVNIMLVTPYQAYNTITSHIATTVNKIDENYRTKTGLKIESREPDLYEYFQTFMSLHMIIAIISVSVFASNINNLVCLWLGKEFQLSNVCVGLMSVYLIHLTTRDILYLIRDGAGLYKESKWLSFWEGMANLILSVLLVRYWGIEGVLSATVFATFVLFIPRNAELVYGVMGRKNTLWTDYLIIGIASLLLTGCFRKIYGGSYCTSWTEFLLKVLGESVISVAGSFITVIPFKWKYVSKLLKR